MLGLVQILAFLCKFKDYLIDAHKYSETEEYNFPLCITMLNFTGYVLGWLREGMLNDIVNHEKSVINVVNKVYCATFVYFFEHYKKKKCNIRLIGELFLEVRVNMAKNLK
jgi:hypothetical protein